MKKKKKKKVKMSLNKNKINTSFLPHSNVLFLISAVRITVIVPIAHDLYSVINRIKII